jgi:hypothetical protein
MCHRRIHADFWHPVREHLRSKYGEQMCVLGWIGAAGDQSPHLMYRKAAEERMRKLRGLTRLEEIARRVVRAVDEAYDVVKDDRHADPLLVHSSLVGPQGRSGPGRPDRRPDRFTVGRFQVMRSSL